MCFISVAITTVVKLSVDLVLSISTIPNPFSCVTNAAGYGSLSRETSPPTGPKHGDFSS